MTDALEINLVGRIMLGSPRHGLSDPVRARVFARAIMAVVEHEYPHGRPSLLKLEPFISEQLFLLETALNDARLRRELGGGIASMETEAADGVNASELEQKDEPVEETAERTVRRRTVQGRGYTVEAKGMEDKLQEERAPVQQLLREDCVSLGLIDAEQAERLVRNMVGRPPAEGEQLVVEQLRQILQDQVKGIIRRLKGGPWSTPVAQEEMRQDIHAARSVRSIISLARQVIKESRAWEKDNGKGSVFGGLFSSHKGLG